MEVFVREHGLSIQRSCRIVGLSRTAFYRLPRSAAERDGPVIEALNRQVEKRPGWGIWKCYDRMRKEGCPWNHKGGSLRFSLAFKVRIAAADL